MDISKLENLGGAALICVAFVVTLTLGMRFLIPHLTAAATANTDRVCESFDSAVKRIVAENVANRTHCEAEITAIREELEKQRIHDREMIDRLYEKLDI